VFFFLSKTLGLILLSVNFLIGIGVLGALLLLTRRAALGRRLLAASVLLLALCGFSPLGKWLFLPLESRFPPWDASHGAPDGIIVLGGGINPDLSAARGLPVLTRSADRIVATAELARRYPQARIVYSGGSGNLVARNAKEADYALSVLEALGVAKERLTVDRLSRNTTENAEFVKALVKPREGEHWLLVTSAFHMPRSIGVFRKAGFPVEAYPVDWRVSKVDVLSFSPLAIEGLELTHTAIREWIGLTVYWATGRTETFFPKPAQS
jgi:uncharacterized SAM-binding protein YcdF (DUF218 family)